MKSRPSERQKARNRKRKLAMSEEYNRAYERRMAGIARRSERPCTQGFQDCIIRCQSVQRSLRLLLD
eukprot:960388-Karenia_brevis.AAC.1